MDEIIQPKKEYKVTWRQIGQFAYEGKTTEGWTVRVTLPYPGGLWQLTCNGKRIATAGNKESLMNPMNAAVATDVFMRY